MPAAIDKALAPFEGKPADLIPALQAVQQRLGWLPPEALQAVARRCRVSNSAVYGVATFYPQFALERQGKHRVVICRGTACHVRGSGKIMRALQDKLGVGPGETTADFKFTLEGVACFGSCALAPVVVVDGRVYANMTVDKTLELIGKIK